MAAEEMIAAQHAAEAQVLQTSSDEELARGAEKLIAGLHSRAISTGDFSSQAWLNVANDAMAKARLAAAEHKARKAAESAIPPVPEPLADGFQPTPPPGSVSGTTMPQRSPDMAAPPPFGGPRHGGI